MNKKHTCIVCGSPCCREGGKCLPCSLRDKWKNHTKKTREDRLERMRKNARKYSKAGKCSDCGAAVGTKATRCRPCYFKSLKGVPVAERCEKRSRIAPPPPKPKKTIADYLKAREPMLYRSLVRLQRSEPDHAREAVRGIMASVRAQKTNAEKSGVPFRVDFDPIREILEDAKKGKFFFETVREVSKVEPRYRYEIYDGGQY